MFDQGVASEADRFQNYPFTATGSGPQIIPDAALIPIFQVNVERLKEGVWLATSHDVPGLIVESQEYEEMVEEVRYLVPLLLEANKGERTRGFRVILNIKPSGIS